MKYVPNKQHEQIKSAQFFLMSSLSQVVRNDWHDDHVEHVVEEEGDGHGHQDQLALSGGLLYIG